MSVLVFGSLNLDLVAFANKLPLVGETVIGEKLLRFPGGKGLNQAIAAKRAGSDVAMVGNLGNDSDGQYLFETLSKEGIDSRFISRVSEQTGTALITVSESGENRIIIIPGANNKITFLPQMLVGPTKPTVSLAQLEVPISEVAKFIRESKTAGCITILNPAPIQQIDRDLLESCDYLIANETESSFLTGSTNEQISLEEAEIIAKQLLNLGSRKVIITLGANGSLYLDNEQKIFTPAFKISAVDTTAAGDAFCGAFAAALAENKPIKEALMFASAAGGLAATKMGAVPSLPNQKEILSMISTLD